MPPTSEPPRADANRPIRRSTPAARVLAREPELAELRAFSAALDLGSIGRAARLLHVSQPALSKRLHALEAVAGTKLLQRSTRGVTATAGLTPVPPLAEIGSTAGARAAASAEGVPVLLSSASVADEPSGGLVARTVAGMRFERQFALIVAGSLQDLTPSARALAQFLFSHRQQATGQRASLMTPSGGPDAGG